MESTQLEHQLAIKKTEYEEARKSGEIFDHLKKIFLEIKDLEKKLQTYKEIGTETITTKTSFFTQSTIRDN